MPVQMTTGQGKAMFCMLVEPFYSLFFFSRRPPKASFSVPQRLLWIIVTNRIADCLRNFDCYEIKTDPESSLILFLLQPALNQTQLRRLTYC